MGNFDMGADHGSREESWVNHRLQGRPGLSKITGSAQCVSRDHFQKHGGLCRRLWSAAAGLFMTQTSGSHPVACTVNYVMQAPFEWHVLAAPTGGAVACRSNQQCAR